MSEKLPCAILGASGYIGQHFARLLADHPWFDTPLLVGTDRSAGKTLEEAWHPAEEPPSALAGERIVEATPARLEKLGVRIVFGAIPSGLAGPIETECVRRGIAVFTNTADHRMEPGVPLLVPEVNADHLGLLPSPGTRAPLVTNPNCTTTGLVLPLAPLLPLLGPEWIAVSSYQALSGAGFPGVASLSVTDNVVPYIPKEEEKVEQEAAYILGSRRGKRVESAAAPFLAQCVRVAVRDGHLEAVTLKSRKTPSLEEIVGALEHFDPLRGEGLPTAPRPPILVTRQPDRPQPLRDRWAGTPARARGMAAVVGRIRWQPPYLRFFVLTHNAVRGGAGGSVINAELAYHRGYLAPRGPRKTR